MKVLVPFLEVRKSFFGLGLKIALAILRVLRHRRFINGPEVSRFEDDFARYLGVSGSVGVANGTDGLEIALEAMNFPYGSEVIVPANSFVASAEAVVRTGLNVIFADIYDDGTLNHEHARELITEQTVALIHVHMFGNPKGVLESARLCEDYGIALIEDCAQAHGARIGQQNAGTFGELGVFSFYPGKVLGGYGDGGAIVFRDSDLGQKCRRIANHGRLLKFDHDVVGRNSRLDSIQAAVLAAKLPFLNRDVQRRNEVADLYRECLAELSEVTLPRKSEDGERHAYHLFVGEFLRRDDLAEFLAENGVQTGIHYPQALDELAPFATGSGDQCEVSRRRAQTMLSLPMGPHLKKRKVRYVCRLIRSFYLRQPA